MLVKNKQAMRLMFYLMFVYLGKTDSYELALSALETFIRKEKEYEWEKVEKKVTK